MTEIPFIKPRFPDPDDLARDLRKIYENNYYSNNGPIYYEFKSALESYLEQDLKAVIVSNATLGLMLAIQALVKKGDANKKYIAIPSFTFAAGPLAIKWCGFEPLFFDVDGSSVQPSIASFKDLLNDYQDEVAGILLINNFGIGNAEADQWSKLLNELDLPCIVDSAPGFGSSYEDGKLLGGGGDCEVFSFHATKPFGIGEGGLITTKSDTLANTLESLKNFGFDAQKETVVMGTNAKITEFDCAIGLRVLANYEQTLKDRRTTYELFRQNLSDSDIEFLPRAETAAIQFASILVKGGHEQRSVIDALKMESIEARTYYAPAVHTFPMFKQAPTVSLENTLNISERIISLPVHTGMQKHDVDRICDTVNKALKNA